MSDFAVIGLNENHDSAAALITSSGYLGAIATERISRVKHDASNVALAIEYLINDAGLRSSEISDIVRCADPVQDDIYAASLPSRLPRQIRKRCRYASVSHHFLHAIGALYSSGLSDCAVLVVDGLGARRVGTERYECASIFNVRGNELERVYLETSTHKPYELDYEDVGLGRLYSYASKHIFGARDDAGKVMALAAFGNAARYPSFLTADHSACRVDRTLLSVFRKPSRDEQDPMRWADLAARVQADVETGMLRYAHLVKKLTGKRNLAVAGGVALNCPANTRIEQSGLFTSTYFMPASTDDGIALGAAFWGAAKHGHPRPSREVSVYLGHEYTASEIELALSQFKGMHATRFSDSSSLVTSVAAELVQDRIVGWFFGGSEFGPRALGSRSILAQPRTLAVRDRINAQLKGRFEFQPVAPIVRSCDVHLYFEVDSRFRSPAMMHTVTCSSRTLQMLPAVVHHDGTARVQTVTEEANPLMHRLLSEVARTSGHGVLVNTSLNSHFEPIAETPTDALAMLRDGLLDVLAMGPYIIRTRN